MYVSLSKLPSPKKLYTTDLSDLSGGLNLWDVPYRVSRNQSPDMRNLLWRDGALGSRRGQKYLVDSGMPGEGYAMHNVPFHGHLFSHVGSKIYSADKNTGVVSVVLVSAPGGAEFSIPTNRGTFFEYDGALYYKNRGGYVKISYDSSEGTFSGAPVVGYVPVILMNADPDTGSGDVYQPENRLQPKKSVWYNAKTVLGTTTAVGDGSTTAFNIGHTTATKLSGVEQVFQGIMLIDQSLYTVNLTAGIVTFTTAPAAGVSVTIVYALCVSVYHLPMQDVESVSSVVVDDVEKTETTDYTVDLTAGVVTFVVPPSAPPITNNTVKITFSKNNPSAYNAIMDCRFATTYGGDQSMCVVFAGATAQKNAYFWNGNTALGMNPGYFPVDYYNLAGDSSDAITGFGQQQSYLIVFKRSSIGRALYGANVIDNRTIINMPYTPINERIGCDLPWTIQLIENNLVFCNSEGGVFYLSNTSSAFENNVLLISRNVNGNEQRHGLLYNVRQVEADTVAGVDDGKRYWIVANGCAYLWDYELSGSVPQPERLSWFYFTNISGVSFATENEDVFYLDASGKLTTFQSAYSDYGEAIGQSYEFAVQNLGGYYNLKDVRSVLISVRSDTNSTMNIVYENDYGSYEEPVPIRVWTWLLYPRNLARRALLVTPFASVQKRSPGFRHTKHFSMRIYNDNNLEDLSLLSAQIFYTYQGKVR